MKKLFTLGILLCSIFTASASLNYFDIYLQKAREGDTEGMYALGLLYYTGKDYLPKDAERACQWFKVAANRGNASAMMFLGVSYYLGTGVSVNKDKALEWLQKSADLGNHYSFFWLGECYNAKGNYKNAFDYYVRSLKAGDTAACHALKSFYKLGIYVEADNAKVEKIQKISDLHSNDMDREAMAIVHELFGY